MKNLLPRSRIPVAWLLLMLMSVVMATPDVRGSADTVGSKYPVFQVFLDPNHDQTEFSIAVDPTDPEHLVIGSNTSPVSIGPFLQGVYTTFDGGLTWNYDTIPHDANTSDPAVAFDTLGNSYYGYCDSIPDQARLKVCRTSGDPPAWGTPVTVEGHNGEDKPHLIVDPFRNWVHTAWRNSNPITVWYAQSRNLGADWVNFQPLSTIQTQGSGVNLATGDGTVIYAAWTKQIAQNKSIALRRSVGSSGEEFLPAEVIFDIDDLDNDNPGISIANHYPSLAVDTTIPGDSVVYMVWDDRPGDSGDYDVFFSRSENQGESWSDPIRVNQDNS